MGDRTINKGILMDAGLVFYLSLVLFMHFAYSVSEESGNLIPAKDNSITMCRIECDGHVEGVKSPIELDIGKRESCTEFSYKNNFTVGTYEANEDYIFESVKQKRVILGLFKWTTSVWKAIDDSEWAFKVVLDGVGSSRKRVIIYSLSGKVTCMDKKKNRFFIIRQPWLQCTSENDIISYSDESKLYLNQNNKVERIVGLEINRQKTTEDFYYFENCFSDRAVYIARDRFLFGSVREGRGENMYRGYNDEIWEGGSKGIYSNKVVISGVCSKSLKSVKIYLTDGTVKMFYKRILTQWTEENLKRSDTGVIVSRHEPSDLKIVTGEGVKENDANRYVIRKYTNKLSVSGCKPISYRYIFNRGTRCIELKHNDNMVWKYDKGVFKEYYPTSIYFEPCEKRITIEFENDLYCEYIFESGWILIKSSTPGPKELEVRACEDTDDFDYYENEEDDSCVYIAKTGRSFGNVKVDGMVIWEDEKNGSVDMVYMRNIGTDREEIRIHFTSGENTRFKLGHSGKLVEKMESGGESK